MGRAVRVMTAGLLCIALGVVGWLWRLSPSVPPTPSLTSAGVLRPLAPVSSLADPLVVLSQVAADASLKGGLVLSAPLGRIAVDATGSRLVIAVPGLRPVFVDGDVVFVATRNLGLTEAEAVDAAYVRFGESVPARFVDDVLLTQRLADLARLPWLVLSHPEWVSLTSPSGQAVAFSPQRDVSGSVSSRVVWVDAGAAGWGWSPSRWVAVSFEVADGVVSIGVDGRVLDLAGFDRVEPLLPDGAATI